MKVFQDSISVTTNGQKTYEITDSLNKLVSKSGIQTGQITVFCKHTSCSLVIMENADPSARRDLEDWLDRLVPRDDPHFTHTHEGSDDMPSHIKMALTRTSETIPISNGSPAMGTWQGLFLWEHRDHSHNRKLVLTAVGE